MASAVLDESRPWQDRKSEVSRCLDSRATRPGGRLGTLGLGFLDFLQDVPAIDNQNLPGNVGSFG